MRVLFTTPKKRWLPFAWLIRWFLDIEWSHTATLMEIEGEQIVFQANKDGTHPLLLSDFLEVNDVIESIEISDEYKAFCFRYSMSKVLNKYSYASIPAIVFRLPFKDGSKRMICSELTARSLGLDEAVCNVDLIDPKQLYDILKTGIRAR